MDPKIIKKTQDTLGKAIKKPPLTEKLLGKPPFRFLHDVITSVIKSTGFMKGLFTDKELNSENIKDRDSKVAFLQKGIDFVSLVTGKSLAVRPQKIVAGSEAEKTNEFLQAIAEAIKLKVNNEEYVKKFIKGPSIEGEEKADREKDGDKKKHKPEDKREKEKHKSHEGDKDGSRESSRDRAKEGKGEDRDREKDHGRDKDRKEKDRDERHRERKSRRHKLDGQDGQDSPPEYQPEYQPEFSTKRDMERLTMSTEQELILLSELEKLEGYLPDGQECSHGDEDIPDDDGPPNDECLPDDGLLNDGLLNDGLLNDGLLNDDLLNDGLLIDGAVHDDHDEDVPKDDVKQDDANNEFGKKKMIGTKTQVAAHKEVRSKEKIAVRTDSKRSVENVRGIKRVQSQDRASKMIKSPKAKTVSSQSRGQPTITKSVNDGKSPCFSRNISIQKKSSESLGGSRRNSKTDSVSQRQKTDSVSQRRKQDITPPRQKNDSTPQRQKVDSTQHQQKVDWTSHRQKIDSTPNRQKVDSTPNRQKVDLTPHRQKGDSTPQRQKGDSTPQRQKGDSTPQRQKVDSTPNRQKVDLTPQRQKYLKKGDEKGKENQQPGDQVNEQEKQESPARIPRPTSAKGSRRRREEQIESDEEDELYQQKPSREPEHDMAEEDLPPQIVAARKMQRPSSARPAPPRPRQDGMESEPAMRLGTGKPTNVIVDNGKLSDDDDDDNFIVEESAPQRLEIEQPLPKEDVEDDTEHGALVKKMLETKKEFEEQPQGPVKKTEIERPAMSDATRRKQRDQVQKEIDKICGSIQSLTRSANPLGKIMDYVQEDLDSMQKELEKWKSENKEHALELKRESGITDRSIEPLKAQLSELEQAISDKLDLIAATKSKIIKNDSKMEKMLMSMSKS